MDTAVQEGVELVLGAENMLADAAYGPVTTKFDRDEIGLFTNDGDRIGRGRGERTGLHHREVDQVVAHESCLGEIKPCFAEPGGKHFAFIADALRQVSNAQVSGAVLDGGR